jgi:hypothetical protein
MNAPLRKVVAWYWPPYYHMRHRRKVSGQWVAIVGFGWKAELECGHTVEHNGEHPLPKWVKPWERRHGSLPIKKRCTECGNETPLFQSLAVA